MDAFNASIKAIIQKYRIELYLLSIAIGIITLSVILFLYTISSTSIDPEIKLPDTEKNIRMSSSIYVDISGAVVKPDVYKLKDGSRLVDLIGIAKGLSEEADESYFKRNFNLAELLSDGQKIYIPSHEEVINGTLTDSTGMAQPSATNKSLISINEASPEELETLPGVGKATSDKIIASRPYSDISELLNNKIVKKNIYEQIKDLVTL